MEDLPERYMTSTKMADTLPTVRYIKSQISLHLPGGLSFSEPISTSHKANDKHDGYDSAAPTLGKGNRRNRQNSDDSTASGSTDPIDSLVDPQTLAQGEGQLIGPSAARELDKRNKKENEDVEKKNDGSLNIKIHLDLHAKVRLDLEADLYGDIVIGLL
jgi:hypothetical protein